jgi:hypothetical protein
MTSTFPPQILLRPDSPRTRLSDPITSHEAADTNNITDSSAAVLAILATEPEGLADWEIEFEHDGKYTGQRLRTARHELVESGLVEDTGEFSTTLSGRRCKVWRLAVIAS